MEYAASGQARLGYATWHDSCMRTIACTAGSRPAIVRAMAVNLGELATYDTAKQASLRTGFMSRFACSHARSLPAAHAAIAGQSRMGGLACGWV